MNKENDIITIEEIEQITDKMTTDGDLREGDFFSENEFECLSDDDLGFYQQSCAYLTSQVITRLEKLENNADYYKHLSANIQTCKKGHKYYAKSHEYPCPWCIINKMLKDERQEN